MQHAVASQPDPGIPETQSPPRPLRLIQLTDSHLFADAAGRLLGLNTRRTFESVLALALDGDTPADAVVMTGDLVQDETAEGYAYLARELEATGLPCFCIPGNHDRRALMEQWLGAAAMGPVADNRIDGWHLIFLDSTLPGEDGGRLTARQVHHLDTLLERDPDRHCLIFLHQHPVPIGSAWLDTMGLANGAQLLAVCDRHPQLKSLIFGHIHQAFAQHQGHYQILGTPSTCFQFRPGSQGFALDDRPPGYRELCLHPDGQLTTRVVRLPAYPEPLSLDASGY
ncbi:3',5'-cyclic-AMP phosphodiesterase [uncultured Thiodictyon sp.]|uniref:3',5'-cyclic-AMP phosphodiesterase n=1 Tax=uncultured Thiodictyon sp. TaxID=1846217 RepID=UPI0025FEF453|nr:3',5'-cyclic-AMP phosphodiesterase [uncultured Thiodictyon sp.]